MRLADGRILRTHDANECLMHTGLVGSCSVHHPSNHPLKEAPAIWLADANTLYRVCPHGVEHPDPDDMEFKSSTMQFLLVAAISSTHISRCDGCCHPHLTVVTSEDYSELSHDSERPITHGIRD